MDFLQPTEKCPHHQAKTFKVALEEGSPTFQSRRKTLDPSNELFQVSAAGVSFKKQN